MRTGALLVAAGIACAARAYAEPAVAPEAAYPESESWHALFSRDADSNSPRYEVMPGDSLGAISKKNRVSVELLRLVNALSGDTIRPGMKLKIPARKFSVIIDKSQSRMLLKGDEEVLKTYVVATGRHNSTPVGTYAVTDKVADPTWYKPGQITPPGDENELGTRWIGLSKEGYGIHGTIHPELLGRQVTHGCIRMRNHDVEELFAFLLPGDEVTVVE